MSRITIPPPQLPPPPSDEDIEKMKTHRMSEEKKAYIREKYEKPLQERERRLKKMARSEWWKNNAVNIATLIISILTLIATIVLGLLGLFH